MPPVQVTEKVFNNQMPSLSFPKKQSQSKWPQGPSKPYHSQCLTDTSKLAEEVVKILGHA